MNNLDFELRDIDFLISNCFRIEDNIREFTLIRFPDEFTIPIICHNCNKYEDKKCGAYKYGGDCLEWSQWELTDKLENIIEKYCRFLFIKKKFEKLRNNNNDT